MTAAAIGTHEARTYESVERGIWKVAHKYARTLNMEFDDLVGEAGLVFAKVADRFDPSYEKSFVGYIMTCVERRFIDLYYHLGRRAGIDRMTSLSAVANDRGESYESQVADDHPGSFSRDEFLEGMSADAAIVLQLVLETPRELMDEAEGKGGQPRNWRSTIRNHLMDIGWAAGRIAESFDEIRGALG